MRRLYAMYLSAALSRARGSIGQRADLAEGTKRNIEVKLPRRAIVLGVHAVTASLGRRAHPHDCGRISFPQVLQKTAVW